MPEVPGAPGVLCLRWRNSGQSLRTWPMSPHWKQRRSLGSRSSSFTSSSLSFSFFFTLLRSDRVPVSAALPSVHPAKHSEEKFFFHTELNGQERCSPSGRPTAELIHTELCQRINFLIGASTPSLSSCSDGRTEFGYLRLFGQSFM